MPNTVLNSNYTKNCAQIRNNTRLVCKYCYLYRFRIVPRICNGLILRQPGE